MSGLGVVFLVTKSFVMGFPLEWFPFQALKVKLKLKEKERIQFLEQQTLGKDEASDFTIVLEEMEQLLEM